MQSPLTKTGRNGNTSGWTETQPLLAPESNALTRGSRLTPLRWYCMLDPARGRYCGRRRGRQRLDPPPAPHGIGAAADTAARGGICNGVLGERDRVVRIVRYPEVLASIRAALTMATDALARLVTRWSPCRRNPAPSHLIHRGIEFTGVAFWATATVRKGHEDGRYGGEHRRFGGPLMNCGVES